jgi:hypothetical protein
LDPRWQINNGRRYIQLVDDLHHTGYSSAALDAQPLCVLRPQLSTHDNDSATRNQSYSVPTRHILLKQEVGKPTLQFRIRACRTDHRDHSA